MKNQILALVCMGFLSVSNALGQVTLVPANSDFSTIDKRRAAPTEKVWEVAISGKRTGLTLINLLEGTQKPKVVAQFSNRRGQTLYTVEQNFSDIGASPWWVTVLFANGKSKKLSTLCAAAGLNDRGDYLLWRQEMPMIDPDEAPYTNVKTMLAHVGGRESSLGVVQWAKIASDGSVSGYFFEDSDGKRGNGVSTMVQQWFKRPFVWKQGKFTLKPRARVK